MRPVLISLLACSLPLTACIPGWPPANVRVVQSETLEIGIPDPGVSLVGVTASPESGRRFLWHSGLGLVELREGGETEVVLGLEALPRTSRGEPPRFTDLAAIDDARFALIAWNDGYLLDLEAGTLTQHFCYEPADFAPTGFDWEQRSDSLAYEPVNDLLFTQAQTVDVETGGQVVNAQVGSFDPESGQDLNWWDLEQNIYAGGIAFPEPNRVIFGAGIGLRAMTLGNEMEMVGSLHHHGVDGLSGMTWDSVTETLLVVDGTNGLFLELELMD